MSFIEKFLGFIVSHKGIKANLKKIQPILDMKPLSSVKDIQN